VPSEHTYFVDVNLGPVNWGVGDVIQWFYEADGAFAVLYGGDGHGDQIVFCTVAQSGLVISYSLHLRILQGQKEVYQLYFHLFSVRASVPIAM
jgi:hypothetical protein